MCRYKFLVSIGLLAVISVLLSDCRGPDCEWSGQIETWVDENENGVWDVEEPPLPNVKVYLESYNVLGIAEAVSDGNGRAHLNAALAGCPRRIEFYVYALPPSGHRSTIRALKPAPDDERIFQFGFIPLSE